jgi:protein-tyrosine phosphatase
MRSLNLAWRRMPIDDRAAPTEEQLAANNAWLDATADPPPRSNSIADGLGRSPTVAIAQLMQRGFTRAEAHLFRLAAAL